jgi:hypothetical protein
LRIYYLFTLTCFDFALDFKLARHANVPPRLTQRTLAGDLDAMPPTVGKEAMRSTLQTGEQITHNNGDHGSGLISGLRLIAPL